MSWTSAPAPNTFGGARRILNRTGCLTLGWHIRNGAPAARHLRYGWDWEQYGRHKQALLSRIRWFVTRRYEIRHTDQMRTNCCSRRLGTSSAVCLGGPTYRVPRYLQVQPPGLGTMGTPNPVSSTASHAAGADFHSRTSRSAPIPLAQVNSSRTQRRTQRRWALPTTLASRWPATYPSRGACATPPPSRGWPAACVPFTSHRPHRARPSRPRFPFDHKQMFPRLAPFPRA